MAERVTWKKKRMYAGRAARMNAIKRNRLEKESNSSTEPALAMQSVSPQTSAVSLPATSNTESPLATTPQTDMEEQSRVGYNSESENERPDEDSSSDSESSTQVFDDKAAQIFR